MRSEDPSSKKMEEAKRQEQARGRVGHVVVLLQRKAVCCLRGAVSPNTHHPLMQTHPIFHKWEPDIPELWHELSKLS